MLTLPTHLNKGEGPKALPYLLKLHRPPLNPANTSHRKLSQLYLLRNPNFNLLV